MSKTKQEVIKTEEAAIETNQEVKEVKKEKKRDYAVDIIRIFACFTVILMHLSLHVYNEYDVQVDWSRLFEKAFFTEGIPLFFMITGFFIANGRTYKKILKGTIRKVLIPVAFYVVFSQIFYKFIVNKESFLHCLTNWNYYINLPGIAEAILKGNTTSLQGICDHLWYIYSYVRIIIWIPVLWLICKDEPTANLARRMLIVIQFVSMLLIDVQRFYTLPIVNTTDFNIYQILDIQRYYILPVNKIVSFTIIDFEIIYVLLGYEMLLHKDMIKGNKKLRWISLAVFFIVNIIRYKLEQQLMIINHYTDIMGRETFVEWRYTALNVITGIFTFAFFYSFDITSERFKKILEWTSDKTFGIYLVHYLIIAKVDLYKFEPLGKLWQELLYLGIGLIVVFLGSILLVMIIRKVRDLLLFICRKIKECLNKIRLKFVKSN